MDLLLLLLALGSALAAGTGVALLVLPGRGRAIERIGLAVPLGFGVVAVMTWFLGYLATRTVLRAAVLVGCVGLLAVGWRHYRRQTAATVSRAGMAPDRLARVFLVLAGLHTIAIAALAFTSQLNWDGLVVWEFKGRIAALSGGMLPREYFADASRAWTHPYYPPYYPLAVAWIYGWLGRTDQHLLKAVFPLLQFSVLCTLFAGARRLAGPAAAVAAPLVVIAVPAMTFGDGGVLSGYVDFPLAACYLPAAVYLAYLWEGDMRALPPLAAAAATLPLVKQEGIVLWAVVATLAVMALGWMGWLRRAAFLLPGVMLFAAWRVHLIWADTPRNVAFSGARAFLENRDRVPVILREVGMELTNLDSWSLLWPAVVLAVPGLAARRRGRGVLLVALAAPVTLLCASYVISNWGYLAHIKGSLSRLLVQVAPVAALVVAVGSAGWMTGNGTHALGSASTPPPR